MTEMRVCVSTPSDAVVITVSAEMALDMVSGEVRFDLLREGESVPTTQDEWGQANARMEEREAMLLKAVMK